MTLRSKITMLVIITFGLFIVCVYASLYYSLDQQFEQKQIFSNDAIVSRSNKLVLSMPLLEEQHLHLVGRKSIYYGAILILCSGLVFSFLLPMILEKVLFRRLYSLIRSIVYITKTQDLSSTLCVSGTDEIAILAGEMNEMLLALSNEKVLRQQALQEVQELNKNLEERVQEKALQLQKQMYTDQLTTTPNRLQLNEDMKVAEKPHLAIINVEQFRTINEFYGYQAGDDLLLELAERLIKLIEPYHYNLYRLAGDEYAILASEGNEKNFTEWMLNIHNVIEKVPFKIHGHSSYLFVTIGIAITKDKPLEKAQMALEYARQYCLPLKVYHDDLPMRETHRNNLHWIHEVQDAIQEDRVLVYYQPIMNTFTFEISKYEVLVRLLGRDGQVISPGTFLPIIKKTKLYPRLTEVILEKSFTHFADKDVDFSINLSAADILDHGVQELIGELLEDSCIAKRVTFEFVESEEFKNPEDLSFFIKRIKAFGAKIAIDDFGSGYSNFAYILNMGAHYIKIDGSLISEIGTNPAMVAIVESIVYFAKQLGIRTIAEYVSSESIFLEAKRIGLDYVQGYHIGKPSPMLVEENKFCCVHLGVS